LNDFDHRVKGKKNIKILSKPTRMGENPEPSAESSKILVAGAKAEKWDPRILPFDSPVLNLPEPLPRTLPCGQSGAEKRQRNGSRIDPGKKRLQGQVMTPGGLDVR
jgi:hypothetical protein